MQPDDPAYFMLWDDHTTRPVVYRAGCYICDDPEFAMMGMPLCKLCPECVKNSEGAVQGHIPADDSVCTDCGFDEYPVPEEFQASHDPQAPQEPHEPPF